MNDKLKSQITTAYMMFIFDFHDPLDIDKAELEKRMPCTIEDLFLNQRKYDRCKRRLEKDINKALSLYFSRFQNQSGVDHASLAKELNANGALLSRQLGNDKVNYLKLITGLLKALEPTPIKKGLLSEHAA